MLNQALKRHLYFAVHDSAKVFFLIGKFIISHPVLKVSKLPIQKMRCFCFCCCNKCTKNRAFYHTRKRRGEKTLFFHVFGLDRTCLIDAIPHKAYEKGREKIKKENHRIFICSFPYILSYNELIKLKKFFFYLCLLLFDFSSSHVI